MKQKLKVVLCGLSIAVFTLVSGANVQAAEPRDCDANAIVRCGAYSISELKGKMNGDIRAIFTHYGIADNELDGVVTGTVRKDGTVAVNGQTVATGARTVGRQNMPGSTHISGINVYERAPNVSFNTHELSAFIKMTNGRFEWAIIQSCGNPVKASPVTPKNPKVEIHKEVSKQTVAINELFEYRIEVKNSGDVDLKNLVVTDQAPEGVVFVTNEAGATSREARVPIDQLAKGATRSFAMNAKVTREVKGRILNTACVDAPEIPGHKDACDTAENNIVCPYNPNLPVGSKDCKQPPKKPVEPTPPVVPEPEQPPTPAVQAAVTPEPVILPETGAAVLGVAGSTGFASYFGSMLYRVLRRKFL